MQARNQTQFFGQNFPKKSLKTPQRSQIDSFTTEIKLLDSEKTVSKSSRIAVYTPFIGPNGLLRSTGRIRRLVGTSFEVKQPVILDDRHNLVKLFVRYLHLENHHRLFDYIRAVIQSQFAVLILRSTLREVKNRCVRYRKRKAKHVKPMMSDLFLERLGYQKHVIYYSGIDYFGPFYVPVRGAQRRVGAFSLVVWRHELSISKFYLLWMAFRASCVLRGSLPAAELRLSSGRIRAQILWAPKRSWWSASKLGISRLAAA